MFERFTEEARRSLFFARAKTLERDGDAISTEDLLGGLLLATPDAIVRFASSDHLRPDETGEEFFERVGHRRPEWTAKASREIRFSAAASMALEKAVQEADALGHTFIRPEHLLLGLLRDEGTEAWRTLHGAGVSLRDVRRTLGEEGDRGEPPSDWGSGGEGGAGTPPLGS
jgi:ATP-dependent Clp protease ATP-binding subunit ClpA